MGKSSVEGTQLSEFVEKKEKLELVASLEEFDMSIKSSSPANSPANETSLRDKEEAVGSSQVNDSALTEGRDPMIWKVNKFQLKGITLDVEAALPPSKRLHRALKAMSANAAEATDDASEAPSDMKIISNGCTDSPKADPLHQPVHGNVGSPMRSECIQSSDRTSFHNNASGSSPSLASQNPEEALMLTPSKVEPDGTLTQSLRSPPNKDCKEMLAGNKECDGPSSSKIPDIDIQEKVIQPCSVRSVENQTYTSNEGISDQLSSPLGVENESETFKECSYLQAEGVRESGSIEPTTEKPFSVMGSKEGNKLLPSNETAVVHSATEVAFAVSNTSGSEKSPSSQSDESTEARDT